MLLFEEKRSVFLNVKAVKESEFSVDVHFEHILEPVYSFDYKNSNGCCQQTLKYMWNSA